jgi:cold shock CspA family protein
MTTIRTLLLFCCLLLLSACTLGAVQEEGYIISKSDSEIWVVPATEKEMEEKGFEELAEAYGGEGTFFNISKLDSRRQEKLKEGQNVIVYYNGDKATSAPAQAGAIKVKVVDSVSAKKPVFEGVIALKWTEQAHQILVINKISGEMLENGTREEIMDIASQEGNGMIFYVSGTKFKELEVGQNVSVTHQGMAQESLPPKTGAERIEVLDE